MQINSMKGSILNMFFFVYFLQVRVIDVFLVEGLKIFYRIGLAIIVLHKKNRGKGSGVKVKGQWHASELVLMCTCTGKILLY